MNEGRRTKDEAVAEQGSDDQRSIAFERGVEDYDRTRELPPDAMEAVLGLLLGELRDHQPCLEIGVGTGRMALPLFERGLRMAGVDLSAVMLAELVRKAGGAAPFPVGVADAVKLPFRDGSFGAGLVVHVLHLIPAWRDALTELARVVRRPGLLMIDVGGRGTGWWKELQGRFAIEAGISAANVGLNEDADVDEHMASLGAEVWRLEPIELRESTTLAERIARLEGGLYSFTWQVDDATRLAVASRLRPWAEERFGSLDETRATSRDVVFRAYRTY